MKFGANTMIFEFPFTTKSLAVLPKIKAMGFDGAEITIDGDKDIDYEIAAQEFKKVGLEPLVCLILSPERDLISDDPAKRANAKTYLKHCIDAIAKMGGKHIAGPLYSAVGRKENYSNAERARLFDMCAEGLSEIARYAADRGVVIGLEPLNRFETSFINLCKQAVPLVDAVNSPALGIHLDTFHMNIEEQNLGEAIELAGSRLVHFHACENDRGAPGSGHVPWLEVARALKKIKYDEWIVIESFVSEIEAIAAAAAIWRPLASSQDFLASSGLGFLKGLFGAV